MAEAQTTRKIRIRVIANRQAILINQVITLDKPIPVRDLKPPATRCEVEIEPEPD
jgi:hypothetical protein